jgi:hypothetical protein
MNALGPPLPSVPCPPSPPAALDGLLSISPAVNYDGNCFVLSGDAEVTIMWAAAPREAVRVVFYFFSPYIAEPLAIGVDEQPSDGAMIRWRTPDDTYGLLYAHAVMGESAVVWSGQFNVTMR